MNAKKPFHKDLEKSFELERMFEAMRKEANPRFLFRIRLSAKLFIRALGGSIATFFYSLTPKHMVTHKIISGLVGLAVLFGGGVSAYAYSSEAVVDGHALYGLKLAIENVEGNFKFSSKAKALYHLKLAERRLDESKHLALEGKADSETEARIQAEVAASENAAAELSEDKDRDETFSQIQSRLEARVEVLKSLLADVEDDGDVDDSSPNETDVSAENQFGQQGAEKSLKHANEKAELKGKVEARLEKKIEHLERLLAHLEEIIEEIEDVAEDAEEDAEDAAKVVEEAAEDAEDAAKVVEEAAEDAEDAAKAVEEAAEDAEEDAEDAAKVVEEAAEDAAKEVSKDVDEVTPVIHVESSAEVTGEFTLESLRLVLPDDMEAMMTTEMLIHMMENLNAASPEIRASMLANMVEQWKLMHAQ